MKHNIRRKRISDIIITTTIFTMILSTHNTMLITGLNKVYADTPKSTQIVVKSDSDIKASEIQKSMKDASYKALNHPKYGELFRKSKVKSVIYKGRRYVVLPNAFMYTEMPPEYDMICENLLHSKGEASDVSEPLMKKVEDEQTKFYNNAGSNIRFRFPGLDTYIGFKATDLKWTKHPNERLLFSFLSSAQKDENSKELVEENEKFIKHFINQVEGKTDYDKLISVMSLYSEMNFRYLLQFDLKSNEGFRPVNSKNFTDYVLERNGDLIGSYGIGVCTSYSNFLARVFDAIGIQYRPVTYADWDGGIDTIEGIIAPPDQFLTSTGHINLEVYIPEQNQIYTVESTTGYVYKTDGVLLNPIKKPITTVDKGKWILDGHVLKGSRPEQYTIIKF